MLAGEAGWGYVYPPGTAQPSMAEYLSHFNSDGSLSSTSTYRSAATDGSDLGARNLPPSGAPHEPPQVECAPIVKVTSPTAGATFTAPATITLAADAVDPDGEIARVEFFANSQHVATELAAPYLLNWPTVPAGTYTLTAVAYDGSGASTTSAPVTFSVSTGSGGGNARPIVTVTSPTAGATFTAPATITLSANAIDPDGEIARVEFFANSQHVATELVAPYLLNWPSVTAGTYTLTAVAYDGIRREHHVGAGDLQRLDRLRRGQCAADCHSDESHSRLRRSPRRRPSPCRPTRLTPTARSRGSSSSPTASTSRPNGWHPTC